MLLESQKKSYEKELSEPFESLFEARNEVEMIKEYTQREASASSTIEDYSLKIHNSKNECEKLQQALFEERAAHLTKVESLRLNLIQMVKLFLNYNQSFLQLLNPLIKFRSSLKVIKSHFNLNKSGLPRFKKNVTSITTMPRAIKIVVMYLKVN